MEKIKVLLTDRGEIFRKGLAKLLEAEKNIEVLSTCSSGLEVIQKAIKLKPDIILLDSKISECDCIEVTRRINELLPETKIIVHRLSLEDYDLLGTLGAKVQAYLYSDIDVKEIIRIVTRVKAGGVIISAPLAAKLLEEFVFLKESREAEQQRYDAGLSKREEEVLALVAKGTTNKEIASALFITESTVKAHLSSILEKLHVRNRQQAAVLATEKGIIRKQ